MGTLKIHSENILPIIKKWLYSEKEIFVRELVSNACDAIHKLEVLQSRGEAGLDHSPFQIEVTIDSAKKQLIFADNGIGMDQEEVEKYIAQIAFSGAEEFVKKYKNQNENDGLIGHFGLGFFSSFMVSEKVEIHTLSYKENSKAVYWSCDGSSSYEIRESERSKRGTQIILSIAKDEEEMLDPAHLRLLLNRYCAFLPYPILLNGAVINEKTPLWVKNPAECTEKEYHDFHRFIFPGEEDPLLWIHLNVDYPFRLKGILYIPKFSKSYETKKDTIKLFCNRVFVSDQCKELLPDYLLGLQGVLDSPDLPLNVSRSALQLDKTIKQLGQHVSKKISDRLVQMATHERTPFLDQWNAIAPFVKIGALQDEKFYERTKEILFWKNTLGEWTTVEEYLERNRPKTQEKVFYCKDEAQEGCLSLYKEKGIEVLFTSNSYLDQALMQAIEKKTTASFQRIDSTLHDALIDTTKEKVLLDASGKTESGKIEDLFRKHLSSAVAEISAKSLTSTGLPGFLMIKEEERRFRDTLAFHSPDMPNAFPLKPTLVLNTNSPLIKAILTVEPEDPELSQSMVHAVYDHACLAQREMDPKNFSSFLGRNLQMLEKLALKLTNTK